MDKSVWGNVVLDVNNLGRLASKYNSPYLEYFHGKIETNHLEEYYDRQVKSGTGHGGWYNENFILFLKED